MIEGIPFAEHLILLLTQQQWIFISRSSDSGFILLPGLPLIAESGFESIRHPLQRRNRVGFSPTSLFSKWLYSIGTDEI
jgi:hypothetical protein